MSSIHALQTSSMTPAISDLQPVATVAPALAPTSPASKRLVSLDVFRGITIVGMLLVNNPGTEHRFDVLEHADWHGWTPTDLIFPFFMFIVGVAIPFSMAKRRATSDQSRGQMLGHIWLRALALVMLGYLVRSMPGVYPALPDGYVMLKILRVVVHLFVWGSMIALLFPWRSRRISIWIEIGRASCRERV